MKSISDNLSHIHEQILTSAKANSRDAKEITLLCVSKTKPVEDIIAAYNRGERAFGESYAVEAAEKIAYLKTQGYNDICWHFIGPIQKNKTRLIAENFDVVESVDREIVAKRLNEQRPAALGKLRILIQVNISAEDQKSGCSFAELPDLIAFVQSCDNLCLTGFMGVARETDDKEEIASSFAQLKKVFDEYKGALNLTSLSIGMTHDLDEAIANGSTEVRIGTAIFGPRVYKKQMNTVTNTKIAFIGGGNMSSCIFKSVVRSLPADKVTVSGPHLEKLTHFKDDGARITTDNLEAIKDADVIFLGVKPQILTAVLDEFALSQIDFSGKLVISMAAGYRLSSIASRIKSERIVRIMPNTPAKIGLGVTAVVYGNKVSSEDKMLTKTLLSQMGTCIEGNEDNLNTIGAICGCGPAFVYRFMEALIGEAVRHGISATDARKMVEQTVLGSVSLVINSPNESIASLRDAVTSKGGTTYAGLCKMTEGHFEDVMQNTINASLDRTLEFERMF
ncbi:MAG: YggS family pyridoxal phosphate-dependent enzyme [Succinivibrio sp.]|nr:YggS family pyridoxal phosphate-dependent enzyme [Succinivibrio sp.]